MKKYMVTRMAVLLFFIAMAFSVNAQKNETVHIKDFNVVKSKNKVLMNWTTGSSANANYFEVEKSVDGTHFKTVALVLGPDPTVESGDSYGCFDNIGTPKNQVYYRLKHVAKDGTVNFSDTKLLALGK